MTDGVQAAATALPVTARRLLRLEWLTARAARLAWGFSVVCAGTMVAIAVWGLNRGFDVTDEGYYLLAYQPRQPPTLGITRFDVLEKALLGWWGPDLIALRAIHLGLVLISSLVLAVGLAYYRPGASSSVARRTAIWFPFLTAVQLTGYAAGPQTLSYNSMVVFIMITTLGLELTYLANEGTRWWLLLPGLSGFLLGLCLFVKFPSSIAGTTVVLAAIAFGKARVRAGQSGVAIRGIGSVAVGYLLGMGLYFLIAEPPGSWWSALSNGVNSASAVSHSGSGILSGAIHDTRSLVKWLLEAGVVISAGVVFHRYRARIQLHLRAAIRVALAGLFLLWSVHAYSSIPSDQRLQVAYLVAIELVAAAIAAEPTRLNYLWNGRPARIWVGCGLALLIPVCGVIGTNNNIWVKTLILLAPWAAALLLLTVAMPARWRSWTVILIVVMFSGLSTAKMVKGYVIHPYRLLAGIEHQTQVITRSGPLANVAVDPQSARFFGQLYAVRSRYDLTGRPMIGMYDLPGVILALGGYGPGDPFIDSGSKGLACQDLERLHPVDPILLIVRGSAGGPPLSCLSQSGIYLSRYRRIARIYDPYQALPLDILAVPPRSSQS